MSRLQLRKRKLLAALLASLALGGTASAQTAGSAAGSTNLSQNIPSQPGLRGPGGAGSQPATLPSTVDSPSFQIYDIPREMSGTVAAQLQLFFAGNQAIRVTTEPNTGRLVVYAPLSAQQDIANRIAALQQEISRSARSAATEASQQQKPISSTT